MMRVSVLSVVLILSCSPAAAVDIYRWVDENGKSHVSDVVPERYKKTAKRIDSTQFEVSDADRRAAEDRAAEDRAASDHARKNSSAAKGAVAAAAAPPPSQRQAVKPKLPSETDCEAAHRQYRESINCFAPYINGNGSTRAEAFEKCTSVPDPSPRCGPAQPY
jgi:hypothetical protein